MHVLNFLIANSVSEAKIKKEQLKITSVTLIGKHWHCISATIFFLSSFFGVIKPLLNSDSIFKTG